MGWFEKWSGMFGGTEDAGLRHGGGERGEGEGRERGGFQLTKQIFSSTEDPSQCTVYLHILSLCSSCKHLARLKQKYFFKESSEIRYTVYIIFRKILNFIAEMKLFVKNFEPLLTLVL